ncbi:MAG: hypothetical protein GX542_09640 [Rhodococcus sp.]|nr:hypothetical protein [Rhodococcus sp. (in: high G+C Gram-positive bacteria)]
MNEEHARLLAELRELAHTALDRIEPVVAAIADETSAEHTPEFAGCQWCPVCAFAALLRGERHELLGELSQHALAIVAIIRELLGELGGQMPAAPQTPPSAPQGPTSGQSRDTGSERSRSAAFESIPITINPGHD